MPNLTIAIGGRDFEVACQEGEEHFLRSAAQLLDNEASVLVNQIGRIPEARMLLMAGLMLADKTTGIEEQLRSAEAKIEKLAAQISALKSSPAPEPQRVEVPGIPPEVTETLTSIAERAEALAQQARTKARAIGSAGSATRP